MFFFDFVLGPGTSSIGFVSNIRAKVASLEVGSSDVDQVQLETYVVLKLITKSMHFNTKICYIHEIR